MTVVAETFIPRASTNIAAVSYDPDAQTLTVTFVSGDVYEYADVPDSVYRGFTAAGSAGKYFFRNVRGVYSYEQQ